MSTATAGQEEIAGPKTELDQAVRFVAAVKKHIYKFDGTYYNMKRVVLNRLWIKVANDFGSGATAKECKARWQAMRYRYTEFMRTGTRMTPFGIESHLDFLIPNLKLDPSTEETTAGSSLADSLEYYATLAGIVEKYPTLYDGKISTDGDSFNSIWKQVAEAMGGRVTFKQIKVQWRNLRHRYTMFLKNGVKIKPYGIESYLEFLKPHLRFWREENPENSLEYNVKLVTIVREHKCLYQGYSSSAKPAAWEDVATKMERDVEWCQTRWTRFRERYCRYLKDGTRMKPTGIETYLTFLDQYRRAKRGEQPESEGKSRKKVCTVVDEESDLNASKSVTEQFRHLKFDASDDDVLFLLRFVQDMGRMNGTQKWEFKVGAIKVVMGCLKK